MNSPKPFDRPKANDVGRARSFHRDLLYPILLKPIAIILTFVIAIGLQCWLYSIGYSRWIVVLLVLLIAAGLIARASWRLFVAFLVAVPVGFLVIFIGFEFWSWFASHTGYFNSKGSGPLGIFLFSVVPGVLAALVTFGITAWLLRYRPNQTTRCPGYTAGLDAEHLPAKDELDN